MRLVALKSHFRTYTDEYKKAERHGHEFRLRLTTLIRLYKATAVGRIKDPGGRNEETFTQSSSDEK